MLENGLILSYWESNLELIDWYWLIDIKDVGEWSDTILLGVKPGIDWLINIKDVGEWSDTILLGVKPGIVEIVAQDLIGNSKGKAYEFFLMLSK